MFKIRENGIKLLGIEMSRQLDAKSMKVALDELVKKFNRAAIQTDKTWLKISEFEDKLFPGLEIKAFNIDQKVHAEAWLSG